MLGPLGPHGRVVEPIRHVHLEGKSGELYRTQKLRILRFPVLDRPLTYPEVSGECGIGERHIEPRQAPDVAAKAGIV